jgi:hypothetical protein
MAIRANRFATEKCVFPVRNPLWAYFLQKCCRISKSCSEISPLEPQLSSFVIGQKYMPN